MFALTVLGEPVPKGRPRFGNGRVYTPPRTVEAETEIATLARAKCGVPTEDQVSVLLEFYCRKRFERKPGKKRADDADNLAKLVLDALNEIVFIDDSQVVHLDVWIIDITKTREVPRTEIRVERVGAAE